jgi:hypothetical protein
VDAGGLALSGEEFEPVLRQSAGMIRHVHASQPQLGSFEVLDPVHARLAAVLGEIGYERMIAIEMRAQQDIIASVRQAVDAVREMYE